MTPKPTASCAAPRPGGQRSPDLRRTARAAGTATGLACLLTASFACAQGSAPPSSPSPIIAYTWTTPPNPSIRLPAGPNTRLRHLQVLIEINDVEQIHGIEFELAYPSDLLRFDEASRGIWLSDNGRVATTLDADVVQPGLLRVEHRRPANRGPVASDDIVVGLFALEFTAIRSGNGTLSFGDRRVFLDGTGAEVPGVSWSTGSVTVDLQQ